MTGDRDLVQRYLDELALRGWLCSRAISVVSGEGEPRRLWSGAPAGGVGCNEVSGDGFGAGAGAGVALESLSFAPGMDVASASPEAATGASRCRARAPRLLGRQRAVRARWPYPRRAR